MCLDGMFGGPSQAEYAAEATQSRLSSDLEANYEQQYADQQDTLKELKAQTQKITSGNTGPCFGGAENAALISGIVNTGGAQARNATQAVQDRSAGQVFNGQTDTSGLARASAIRQQVAGNISSQVGANTANALNAETAANYAQGRQNATTAAGELAQRVSLYNPAAYASGASSSSLNAAKLGQQISQEQSQKIQSMFQFGAKLAGSVVGGAMGGLGAGGGLMDTLKGVTGGAMGDGGMFLQDPNQQ